MRQPNIKFEKYCTRLWAFKRKRNVDVDNVEMKYIMLIYKDVFCNGSGVTPTYFENNQYIGYVSMGVFF